MTTDDAVASNANEVSAPTPPETPLMTRIGPNQVRVRPSEKARAMSVMARVDCAPAMLTRTM